ncbi:putative bifunctional diguanylate cyclase/phosphodiesterase [Pseudomonas oryzae]|uniref:cyclic-guanylate-specific phosphodiesterase n=1 Tax=Pseudomonas oryzae TaxID=1392877 RepID=A0A1H1QY27_9PSED|nr:EAL domain-containing protein [Pseudomonas oryzae]SDS28263.1 PAS domain S-box-containing protein/diguanylate cyclase (GGDEF) domain-containing protein [Pseudomonas oryzae]
MSQPARPLRLLLIEDDEREFLIIRGLLREAGITHYELDWVNSFAQGLAALDNPVHDLFLIDYRLGDDSGLELLRHACARQLPQPLILLSRAEDGDLGSQAIAIGAADHLIKGEFDGRQLGRSIRYALERARGSGEPRGSNNRATLLQRCLEASYNGVVIADAQSPDYPVIYVNPAFERITGYSPSEVIGRNVRFLQGRETQQPGLDAIRRSLARQREAHVVLRNFRKDGSAFWNDLYIAPVPDERGVVTHYIGVQNDISERKRFESELAYNASHDVLTGLPNRSLLEDRLQQGCQIARRYSRELAVMLIDLDGFKPINDTLGHAVGDKVLVEVAQRMNEEIRPGDTLARLGGDEFVVLLPDLAHGEDALLVAERLIRSIARPYRFNELELHVTASIGITLSDGDIEQPMKLIQEADLAMYQAKQHGRNNYQWYTEHLNQEVSERMTLRNELQKTIGSMSFELHYQPQVDARRNAVIGSEALLRWRHPERGMISPMRFIPVAEDTGQIIPISQWVLDTACRHNRELLDRQLVHGPISVNISAVHFLRSNFVETVQRALEESGLPAPLLELEITESVLLKDAERAIRLLHELKELGVGLALDDFGTGYSSLSYLKDLPIDKVKIDRSFIQDLIRDPRDAAITQGIISMAHHLDLLVVAEGVETPEQAEFLTRSQCDVFQGHLYSRPMPFTDLEHYLQERQRR